MIKTSLSANQSSPLSSRVSPNRPSVSLAQICFSFLARLSQLSALKWMDRAQKVSQGLIEVADSVSQLLDAFPRVLMNSILF